MAGSHSLSTWNPRRVCGVKPLGPAGATLAGWMGDSLIDFRIDCPLADWRLAFQHFLEFFLLIIPPGIRDANRQQPAPAKPIEALSSDETESKLSSFLLWQVDLLSLYSNQGTFNFKNLLRFYE